MSKLTKVSIVIAKLPSYTLKFTDDVISKALADNKGNCVIAVAGREQVEGGIESITVTKHEIRFNKFVELNGKMVLMRHVYRNPLPTARAAEKFDADYYAHGIDYARKEARKSFPKMVRLQGRDATLKPLVVQPRGADRKVRVKGYRLRAATKNDKVVNCNRRYHLPAVKRAEQHASA